MYVMKALLISSIAILGMIGGSLFIINNNIQESNKPVVNYGGYSESDKYDSIISDNNILTVAKISDEYVAYDTPKLENIIFYDVEEWFDYQYKDIPDGYYKQVLHNSITIELVKDHPERFTTETIQNSLNFIPEWYRNYPGSPALARIAIPW